MTVNQVTEAIVDFKYVNGTSSKVKIKGPFRTEVVSPNVDIDRASYEELASRAEQYASEIAEQATKLKKYRVNPTRFWTESIKSALEREGQKFSELATKLNNVKEVEERVSPMRDSDGVVDDAKAKIRKVEEAEVDDVLNQAVTNAEEAVASATEAKNRTDTDDAATPAAKEAAASTLAEAKAREAAATAAVVAAKAEKVDGVGTVEELERLKSVVARAEAAAEARPEAEAGVEQAKKEVIQPAKAAKEAAEAVQAMFKRGDIIYNKVNERIDFANKVKSRMEEETNSSTPPPGGGGGGTSGGGALTSRGYVAKKIKPYSSNNITNKLNIIKPKAKKSRVAKLKLDKLNRKVQEYSKKIRNLKKISRRVTYKKQ